MKKTILICILFFLILLTIGSSVSMTTNPETFFKKIPIFNLEKEKKTKKSNKPTESTKVTVGTNKNGEYIFDVSNEHAVLLFKFKECEIPNSMKTKYKNCKAKVNSFNNMIIYDNRTNKKENYGFTFSIGFIDFKFDENKQKYNTELEFKINLKQNNKEKKKFSINKNKNILIILENNSIKIKQFSKEKIHKYILK